MNALRIRTIRRLAQLLARLGGWPRRLLAAALLLAALAAEFSARPPVPGPAPPTHASATVLAAVRDLAAGSVLGAQDVRTVRLPSDAVPAHALTGDPAVVAGRRLAGPVRRGEALTDVRLVGPGLAAGLAGSHSVAVPVRLADPASAVLLRPGSRVDLLAGPDADPDGAMPVADRPAAVLAADVTVLAVVPVDAGRIGGPLLVVAASPATARRLAGAGARTGLTVALRPP